MTPKQEDAFEDLATELFVVAQISPADDGFSETIERIESWLREHFTTPAAQSKPLTNEQMDELVFNCGISATARDIARAIEQAYNIKE
jgi:hypothetical protein